VSKDLLSAKIEEKKAIKIKQVKPRVSGEREPINKP